DLYRGSLRAELAEVVVDVLVHQLAPLLAAELSKEGVSLFAGRVFTPLREAVDEIREPRSLRRKIPLVGDDEGRVGRSVPAERLLAQDGGSDEGSENLAQELLLHRPVAGGRLQRARAVTEHLRRSHLSPLPRDVGLQVRDARQERLAVLGVEE